MFESITTSQSDTLLALMGAYRADARAQKMDVGVGVYRDKDGATPVMSAVKTAEARVLASQDSKAYLGLVGNAEFNAAMVKLVLPTLTQPVRMRWCWAMTVAPRATTCGQYKHPAVAARCAHCSIWLHWHDQRHASG